MKPLIRKRIRQRYRREQLSNGEFTPTRRLYKTVIHYNDQGKECCSYDYFPNGFIYKSPVIAYTEPDLCNQSERDENSRTYDIIEQKRNEAGAVVYEKRNYYPTKGWDSNYITYADELPFDNILITGTKELFFRYDAAQRHMKTDISAVFHYRRCDDQGQPLALDHPETIVTIKEKYQYNEDGNPTFEQKIINYSKAIYGYREETERKFYYDTAGNQVKEDETSTYYDSAGRIENICQTCIYDKIIYQ